MINLKKLEIKVDKLLTTETTKTLTEWLTKHRNKMKSKLLKYKQ